MDTPPTLQALTHHLPQIPLIDAGCDWPLATIDAEPERTAALLTSGARGAPAFAVRLADRISRRWLAKWDNPRLAEIDAIDARLRRPGAYFLNTNYEWTCTSRVDAGPDGRPRLVRALDWRVPGLGRNLILARIDCGPAPWLALTWPGYTGVLTALAPGRFAAAINQPPMATPLGFLPVDWALARHRVWHSPHPTPAHLLREVFEHCADYAEAKRRLIETPICLPGFYTLAGIEPGEGCLVERLETEARVHEMPATIANDWLTPGWTGRVRGSNNRERRAQLACAPVEADDDFAWLTPPVLNDHTRLAAVLRPATGALAAVGVEAQKAATGVYRGRFGAG